MLDLMVDSGAARFAAMAREYPVRTCLFTAGPLLFAIVQLFNSVAHGVSLLHTGAFALVVLAFAVQVNRYHLASFRRAALSRRWPDAE